MNLDILLGYIQGYKGICKDISGYLDWISFLGYDLHSYPKSQKISFLILSYPFISFHILTYPKISSGANSQMYCSCLHARPAPRSLTVHVHEARERVGTEPGGGP